MAGQKDKLRNFARKPQRMALKLKICGMRDPDNLRQVVAHAQPDYVGFIFHPASPRYAGGLLPTDLADLPRHVVRTGVFVNDSLGNIRLRAATFGLGAIQLHGDEPPEFCQQVRQLGHLVVKAFAVDASFDFARLADYREVADYFLFDTKGQHRGGNGRSFDWSLLDRYDNAKPFFLSGGIDLEHLAAIRQLTHLNLYGVDINSKFEVVPGVKQVAKTGLFADELRKAEDGGLRFFGSAG
jgi:phosphoribosylanthranilate isomerase